MDWGSILGSEIWMVTEVSKEKVMIHLDNGRTIHIRAVGYSIDTELDIFTEN